MFSKSLSMSCQCCFHRKLIVCVLGGVPNLDVMTFDQHEKMLEGCISNVYIQGKGPLDLTTDAIGGVNVVPCLT